jgi:DNA-binding HxlR family transcriptional regulator
MGGSLISYVEVYNNLMVITESPSTAARQDSDFEVLAHVYKILGNPTRLRILSALESSSLSFTELMRALDLNPKTLSSGLNLMGKWDLIRKSYPHQVYVITPLGRRIIREQVLALQESLQPMLAFERRPK